MPIKYPNDNNNNTNNKNKNKIKSSVYLKERKEK